MCDLRCAIYDLRFTGCDLRFTICDLRFTGCEVRLAQLKRKVWGRGTLFVISFFEIITIMHFPEIAVVFET